MTIKDMLREIRKAILKMTPDDKAKIRRALDRTLLGRKPNTQPN